MKNKLTDGEIFYYNWNRISLLTHKSKVSNFDREEISMRMRLHNTQNAELIKDTITNSVIKSVDTYIKNDTH